MSRTLNVILYRTAQPSGAGSFVSSLCFNRSGEAVMLRNRLSAVLAIIALFVAVPQAARAQGVPTPVPVPLSDPDPSDPFFDDTVLHDIKLTINVKDWESLKVHYLENTPYPSYFQWRD